ncbi:MAG: PmoA family protein [Verrucomicrobia bacterium]|nr:PmoA family protein [Verrucomicrobiota bacterium]
MSTGFRTALLAALLCLPAARISAGNLSAREDPAAGTITVWRDGGTEPILTQNARPDFRPYLHPLVAPGGRGVLTEVSPGHHPHQTGIFWGFTRVNGRDYFHTPGGTHWRRAAASVIIARGEEVKWSTVYHLLDDAGRAILTESQLWTLREAGAQYQLDLEWTGEAQADLVFGTQPYGGLFVRMPWRPGVAAAAVNNARQRDQRANGQRAVWVDVSLPTPEGGEPLHLAVFDHPRNDGYPHPWRVDQQFGFGPARAALGEWKLARGARAVFRHRLLAHPGRFDDVALDAAWRAYTGERLDSVLWNLAREEGRRAVFLTGEQAVAKMTVPAGFEVKLAASEPLVTQPMAFCWDHRGRLWVGRRTGFSSSGDSRIVILEDTDGDGRMDRRQVFLEGIPFPSALAVGFDGLWLGAPPHLLFVPDRNHDDRADADIEVRLTGWGIQDRHETLNSLTWGPDGWLYGCQGFATRSQVGKPPPTARVLRKGEAFPENAGALNAQYLDGGVWRYHPTKDRFEVVAHGFSNPWGLDFDAHGQMFVTACVIPHLWHVIPGGIYHRQGGRHLNPHVYDDLKTIADHRHRSAHGGARVYLADEFPREYRGRIFMANLHERALLTDVLTPRGSGFVGSHGDDILQANDPQWIGFSVEVGPDGAVYVLDWHDADICGNAVLNKDTGRIFRLAPTGLPARTGLDLRRLDDLALVELQWHRNDWYVRRARLLLQERAAAQRLDPRVPSRLWEMFAQGADAASQLRALWALHVTGQLPPDRLLPLLNHPEPYVRGWAIQLLHEDRPPAEEARRRLAVLARQDPSPVVRLYLAAALQRLPPAERWAVAEGLVTHAEDATDHNLPKMIWFGLEPLVRENPARALALATASRLPLVTQFVARRATAARQIEAVVAAVLRAEGSAQKQSLLEGLRDGLGAFARREIAAPSNWAELANNPRIGAEPALRHLVDQLGQKFGDPRATAAQVAALANPATPAPQRLAALQTLARDAHVPALSPILALLDEPAFRRDAIRALAEFDDRQVPGALLARFASWSPAEKADAVMTLAARPESARLLLRALREERVPRRDISAFAARQLQRVLGPAFSDFWGPVTSRPADKEADLSHFRRLLSEEALARANPPSGRAIFERTCAACHQLYGNGGRIGPDLTGSNRANLDYLLGEIISPSEVIQEGYHLVTLTTRDGRTLAGNVAQEDAEQVTLRLVGQETVVPKAEILSREKSDVSMMPEGLLKHLSSQEVLDLVAYLRTTDQVPLPASVP